MPNNSITKPCHNCRRRRLRCDRSWPSCHKCALSGQECLGYGKVFVWTQAIDSNGNPRPSPVSGRRPGETEGFQPQAPHEFGGTGGGEVAISWAVPGAGSRDHHQIHDVQDIYSRHDHDEREHSGHGGYGQQQPLALRGAMPGKVIDSTDETATGHDGAVANAQQSDHQVDVPSEVGMMGGGSLTDPLFQDLDRNSRHYLAHCKLPEEDNFLAFALHAIWHFLPLLTFARLLFCWLPLIPSLLTTHSCTSVCPVIMLHVSSHHISRHTSLCSVEPGFSGT